MRRLLARFDLDERYAAEFPGLRRDVTATVVRQVDLIGHSGIVIHSRLTPDSADQAIREQIEFFRGQGQDFEWKVYSHDQPPDLTARLAAYGFAIGECEAVMVLDLHDNPPLDHSIPDGVQVRRVADVDGLREVASVKERVYGKDATALLDRLTFEMDNAPRYLSVYVAEVDGRPAATAWVRFPDNSVFASLWGGSTLPELRNRGLYTALLAARVAEANRRGKRYVTVDAGAMSRPILEKRGFHALSYATACNWYG